MATTKVGWHIAERIKTRCSTGFVDKMHAFSCF
jgi:hypothetical protein